ncbi:MAG: hypothetical protein IPO88_24785 [Nannocystis sp.]|uniref:hypothetical protein n=1 Tax=Nannocystis sp. TaxID=1962667 RepID=UPI0024290847|nr:hypothetical protein [Nannocystis sp.]MBK9756658.1 hypothetical protein [Nannocystis sp.]
MISVVHFTISDIRIHLSGSANAIIVEGTDFTSTSQISRSVDADARLAAAGIDPLEAARVEGHISYGVVTSALGATLGQRREIALDRLFPAINFGDSIALSPLQNGEFLAFVPVAKHGLRRDAHCECNEATGIAISTTAVTDKTIPANPVPNDQIGKVTIGGPIAENLNPMADLGHRAPGKGRAGLLLPKETYHGMTVTAMPAVVVRASDNGFIGFDARGTVGFQEANVSLDAASGGIIVSVKMDISVTATSTLDMGKGRRLPIGYAIITPVAGSSAELEMGFYPYVDDGGTVRLRGTLQKCDMGTYIAVVLGIGTALKIIGVAAWIGFLIDVVLSAIISNNLPIVLRRSVVKAIGAGEWKLIGGDSIAQLDGFPKGQHFVARYDVDGDSLLVSFGTDKG